MATSVCPKCGGSQFEIALHDNVKNARVKFYFIQCSACGCVVGTHEYHNIGTLIYKLAKKMGVNLDD